MVLCVISVVLREITYPLGDMLLTLMDCRNGRQIRIEAVNCMIPSGDIQFHREPQRDHRGLRAKLFRAFVLFSFHKRDIKLWPTIFKILDKKIFEQDHCLSSGSNPSCKNLNLCGSLCDLCGSP